jgi:hypothetical protein
LGRSPERVTKYQIVKERNCTILTPLGRRRFPGGNANLRLERWRLHTELVKPAASREEVPNISRAEWMATTGRMLFTAVMRDARRQLGRFPLSGPLAHDLSGAAEQMFSGNWDDCVRALTVVGDVLAEQTTDVTFPTYSRSPLTNATRLMRLYKHELDVFTIQGVPDSRPIDVQYIALDQNLRTGYKQALADALLVAGEESDFTASHRSPAAAIHAILRNPSFRSGLLRHSGQTSNGVLGNDFIELAFFFREDASFLPTRFDKHDRPNWRVRMGLLDQRATQVEPAHDGELQIDLSPQARRQWAHYLAHPFEHQQPNVDEDFPRSSSGCPIHTPEKPPAEKRQGEGGFDMTADILVSAMEELAIIRQQQVGMPKRRATLDCGGAWPAGMMDRREVMIPRDESTGQLPNAYRLTADERLDIEQRDWRLGRSVLTFAANPDGANLPVGLQVRPAVPDFAAVSR